MQTTSLDYQTAVVAGSRSSSAKIYFGVFDVTAKLDSTPVANTTQPFTSVNAIKGDIRNQDFRLASFEDNYFKLDGGMYLLPNDANPVQDIIGWWSQAISDASRQFSTPPTITVTFGSLHSSIGFNMFFGSEEYCTEFDFTFYNGATQIGYTNITGNDKQDFNMSYSVANYNKIIIRFFKTRNPYRYVRVMELEFGQETQFDGDTLIKAAIVEEVDPVGATLSTNTLKFTVLNVDQSFNMLNPQGVYAYLQKRQKIVAQSGLLLPNGLYEYVPMGTYYLSDWKNSTGITASLEATDAMGLLDKTTYRASSFWTNTSVETVLRHILDDSGITYSLTVSAAAAAEVVSGYIPPKSHRAALADALIASRNVLRMDRSGVINVMKIDYVTALSSLGQDTLLNSPTISQKALVTSVEATEYTYAVAASASQLSQSTFNLIGTQSMSIPYGKAASAVSVTVTGSGSIVGSPTYSAVAVTLTITGTGSVTVTVNGKEYLEAAKTVRTSITLPAGEVPQTATLADNKLIYAGKGTAIAQNTLDYFQKRIKQQFDYWNNPAIQSGDCINVQTMFGASFKGVVERQEITFAPNLVGKMEVTG